jgi:FkbM family methyltransferase
MFRIPHAIGALTYAIAWLSPWRSLYRVRPTDRRSAFIVHRRDVIGRHIAKYGAHEPDLTKWIANHLEGSSPGIFVDAGANIGWHTIHAARHACVETVVAFEPDQFNAWLLDRNVQLNKVNNVVLCAYALGAMIGKASLHRYKDSNLGRHSLACDHEMGDQTVPVRDLDSALNSLGLTSRRILLLKIDVEGYEPAVIKGAKQALERTDVVVLEYSPELSREGGLSIDDMVSQLYSHGFMPFSLGNDGRIAPLDRERIQAFEGQTNIIWRRAV